MKILFNGFLVSPEHELRYFRSEARPQTAALKFQAKVLLALESRFGGDLEAIGSVPISSWPVSKLSVFKGSVWGRVYALRSQWAINFPLLNQVTRFVTIFAAVFNWCWKYRGEREKVLFNYAVSTPTLLPAFVVSRIFRVKLVVYIPDLPEYMDMSLGRKGLMKLLKSLDTRFLRCVVRSVEGIVAISPAILENKFPNRPGMVLDFVVEPPVDGKKPAAVKGAPAVLYCGGLVSEYGVDVLLDAFSSASLSDVDLLICGSGALAERVQAASSERENIHYLGYVAHDEVLALQQAVSILINPRSDTSAFANYSFPSKVAEYLSSGRPIISGNIPSMCSDLREFIYFLPEVSEDAIRESIVALTRDLPRYEARSLNAYEYVSRSRAATVQGDRLGEFFNNLG